MCCSPRIGIRPGTTLSPASGLAGYLRERGLTDLTVAGLAFDYCVLYSALDARRLGFGVTVVQAGCRAIDLDGSAAAATAAMQDAGVRLVGAL